MKDKHTIIIAIVVALIAGSGGYFAGTKHSSTVPGFGNRNFQSGERQGGQGAGRAMMRQGGGGFVTGSIVSRDDTSVTVKLPDGGSKIVFYTPTTAVMKSATGTIADLSTGENIMVMGTANPDGSVSATSIQLRGTTPTRREP